jgi:hypothetical protein
MTGQAQQLIVVAALAILDVANYIWGIEAFGVQTEKIIGVILTIVLAGMAGFPTFRPQPRK